MGNMPRCLAWTLGLTDCCCDARVLTLAVEHVVADTAGHSWGPHVRPGRIFECLIGSIANKGPGSINVGVSQIVRHSLISVEPEGLAVLAAAP